jgi:hypothetical protein
VDLDKAENKIKENNKLDIPSIATAPAAALAVLAAPAVAPIAPAVAPVTALAATPLSTRIATPALSN